MLINPFLHSFSTTLFQLFYNGVELLDEDLVLDMDSLGLAHHYGYHTEVIDFTSDYNAEFFACTKSGANSVHQPISSNDLYGVLYMLLINLYKPIFAKDIYFLQGAELCFNYCFANFTKKWIAGRILV